MPWNVDRALPAAIPVAVILVGMTACSAEVETAGDSATDTRLTPQAPAPTIHAQPRDPASSAPTFVWTERSDLRSRLAPSLIDQPTRQRVLIYGGWTRDGVLSETWEWDGFGMIRRVPNDNPGPRMASAITFDTKRERVLLFGGMLSLDPAYQPASDQLWQWNGSNWQEVHTAHSPQTRSGSTLVWDSVGGRALLFGGGLPAIQDDGSIRAISTDQLWSFDGLDWTELHPEGAKPEARTFHAAVWDPIGERMLVHGGFRKLDFVGGRINPSPEEMIRDTWAFDGKAWSKLGGEVEMEMGVPSLGFDTTLQKPVLLAERVLSLHPETGRQGRTSLLVLDDDDGWRELHERPQPNGIAGSAFTLGTWSSANGGMLSLGGVAISREGLSGQIIPGGWLAYSAGGWEKIDASANLDALQSADMAHSGTRGILFGGLLGSSEYRDDTYAWNGGRWTRLTPPHAPPARFKHAMSELGPGRVLLFGGAAGSLFGDTWIWDDTASDWAEQLPTDDQPRPPARTGAALAALDADRAVLFGGRGSAGLLDDTWIFTASSGRWQRVSPSPAPPARENAAAVSLPGTGRMQLFGGTGRAGSSDVVLGDLWRFDGSRWELTDVSALTVRTRARMARDLHDDRVLLVGGAGDAVRADVWDFTTTSPSGLLPIVREDNQSTPRRRQEFVLSSNPGTGGWLMFGGLAEDGSARLADTWQLQRFGAACSESSECAPGQFCTDGVCCEASSCGPCRSCAISGTPGFCTARGEYASEPRCAVEEGMACSADGVCRAANERACSRDDECASGTCAGIEAENKVCCAAAGCAVRCVDGQLRNPDGSRTSCGLYGCEADSCKSQCSSVADCAAGAVCADNVCVNDDLDSGETTCACRSSALGAGSRPGGNAPLWLGVLLALARWRRRASSAG